MEQKKADELLSLQQKFLDLIQPDTVPKTSQISLENRRLDSLSRLLENEHGCVAVCVVNQTLHISANSIHKILTHYNKLKALLEELFEHLTSGSTWDEFNKFLTQQITISIDQELKRSRK
jgi:hypothetical protein